MPPAPNRSTAVSCTLETLARSRALHVQRCAHCNTLSLHFGPITLRFDAATVEEVWNTLGQALLRLHAHAQAHNEERVDTWEGAN
jgi:non-ribosomal peptide synthetase component F